MALFFTAIDLLLPELQLAVPHCVLLRTKDLRLSPDVAIEKLVYMTA